MYKKLILIVFLFLLTLTVFAVNMDVQYTCYNTYNASNQIHSCLNIRNLGSETISLNKLVLRYFYTKEGTTQEQMNIDYAVIGSSNISTVFGEGYFELSFSPGAGNLAPGKETGQIQSRLHKTDWTPYNQSNDCSFNPSYTGSFVTTEDIALYYNGELVWGNPCGVATPTPTFTPTPTPTLIPSGGEVRISPTNLIAGIGENCKSSLFLNSGNQNFAAYSFDITYNSAIINVNTSIGTSGITAGADGFVAAVNTKTPGIIKVAGFDNFGKGPGEKLHILDINWTAVAGGTSAIGLKINKLVDAATVTIGMPREIPGSVTVVQKVSTLSFSNIPMGAHIELTINGEYINEPFWNKQFTVENGSIVSITAYDGGQIISNAPPCIQQYIFQGWEVSGSSEILPRTTTFIINTDKHLKYLFTTETVCANDPIPTPTPPILPPEVSAFIFPASMQVSAGSNFGNAIHVNSGTQKLAAYGFRVTFPANILELNNVSAGADGFYSAVNANIPGDITIAGFDVAGKGPGNNLEVVKLDWSAIRQGTAAIGLSVSNMTDPNYNDIGNGLTKGATIVSYAY